MELTGARCGVTVMLRTLKGLFLAQLFGNLAIAVFSSLAGGMDAAGQVKLHLIYTGAVFACLAFAGWLSMFEFSRGAGTSYASMVGAAFGAAAAEFKLRRADQPEARQIESVQGGVLEAAQTAALIAQVQLPTLLRAKVYDAMINMVLRYHNGLPLTRKTMTEAGVTNQAYWNLANYLLGQLGLREDTIYHTRGNDQEDIKWLRNRVRVVSAAGLEEVWVWPANEDGWVQVDLRKWFK